MTASVLEAREERWQRKTALASQYGECVLSLGLNIPGPDKEPAGVPEAFALLDAALDVLLREHAAGAVLHEERVPHSLDGPYSVRVTALPPEELKRLVLRLEEEHPLGRLADADVLSADGRPVSRRDLGLPPRPCFLCAGEAALCRRAGTHGADEILAHVRGLLRHAIELEHIRQETC